MGLIYFPSFPDPGNSVPYSNGWVIKEDLGWIEECLLLSIWWKDSRIDLPGARMESPWGNPMISLIFFMMTLSMRMKTGAIS